MLVKLTTGESKNEDKDRERKEKERIVGINVEY